jgi:hypothetical protein
LILDVLASTQKGITMLHWKLTTAVMTALVVCSAFFGELDGFIWS